MLAFVGTQLTAEISVRDKSRSQVVNRKYKITGTTVFYLPPSGGGSSPSRRREPARWQGTRDDSGFRSKSCGNVGNKKLSRVFFTVAGTRIGCDAAFRMIRIPTPGAAGASLKHTQTPGVQKRTGRNIRHGSETARSPHMA